MIKQRLTIDKTDSGYVLNVDGVFAVVIVIGFVLWIFADVCDEQARKEGGQCD